MKPLGESLHQVIEYIVISLIASIVVVMVLPSARKSLLVTFSGVLIGPVAGYGTLLWLNNPGLAVFAAFAGTIAGPALVAAIHRMPADEILKKAGEAINRARGQ